MPAVDGENCRVKSRLPKGIAVKASTALLFSLVFLLQGQGQAAGNLTTLTPGGGHPTTLTPGGGHPTTLTTSVGSLNSRRRADLRQHLADPRIRTLFRALGARRAGQEMTSPRRQPDRQRVWRQSGHHRRGMHRARGRHSYDKAQTDSIGGEKEKLSRVKGDSLGEQKQQFTPRVGGEDDFLGKEKLKMPYVSSGDDPMRNEKRKKTHTNGRGDSLGKEKSLQTFPRVSGQGDSLRKEKRKRPHVSGGDAHGPQRDETQPFGAGVARDDWLVSDQGWRTPVARLPGPEALGVGVGVQDAGLPDSHPARFSLSATRPPKSRRTALDHAPQGQGRHHDDAGDLYGREEAGQRGGETKEAQSSRHHIIDLDIRYRKTPRSSLSGATGWRRLHAHGAAPRWRVGDVTGVLTSEPCRDDLCRTLTTAAISPTAAPTPQGPLAPLPPCPPKHRRALRSGNLVCEPLRASAANLTSDDLCDVGEEIQVLPGGRGRCVKKGRQPPVTCKAGQVAVTSEEGVSRCHRADDVPTCPLGQTAVALGNGFRCQLTSQPRPSPLTPVTLTPACPPGQRRLASEAGPVCLPDVFSPTLAPCPAGLAAVQTSVGVFCLFASSDYFTAGGTGTRHTRTQAAAPASSSSSSSSRGEPATSAATVTVKPATAGTKLRPFAHTTTATATLPAASTRPCPQGQRVVSTPRGPRCLRSAPTPRARPHPGYSGCTGRQVLTQTAAGFFCLDPPRRRGRNPLPSGGDNPHPPHPEPQPVSKGHKAAPTKGGKSQPSESDNPSSGSNPRFSKGDKSPQSSKGDDPHRGGVRRCGTGLVWVRLRSGRGACLSRAHAATRCGRGQEMRRDAGGGGWLCAERGGRPPPRGGGEGGGGGGRGCGAGEVVVWDGRRALCHRLEDDGRLCGPGLAPRLVRGGAEEEAGGVVCAPEEMPPSCPPGTALGTRGSTPACLPPGDPCQDSALDKLAEVLGARPSCRQGDLSAIPVPCQDGYSLAAHSHAPTCRLHDYVTLLCTQDGDVTSCIARPATCRDTTASRGCGDVRGGCRPRCANGGRCVGDRCRCPSGLHGKACMTDIDECRKLPADFCQHGCLNTFGSFRCTCPAMTTLNADGRTCQYVGCLPRCENGGRCKAGGCVCRPGYTGRYCQRDVDECGTGRTSCQHLCLNTRGSYSCVCPPASRLAPDRHTCLNATCSPACRNGGLCESGACHCPQAFTGRFCQLDVNECRLRQPGCSHRCLNTYGSFRCICPRHLLLGPDGKTCTKPAAGPP